MGHEFLLLSSHTSHDDRMVYEKFRTTAAFKDEGTSAVEMSVEAALYGVTWPQQIRVQWLNPCWLMIICMGLYYVILSNILGTITIHFHCRS